jgi:fructokinase
MILSCGDALIDFVPVAAADGGEALRPMVGGSCLNVAVGLARLGVPTGFVGGISNDLFGRMIAEHALASRVDLRFATRSDYHTTLAFVRMIAGESQYAFYDTRTASREWTYRQGMIDFGNVHAVHIGSTTLANEDGAAQIAAMIAEAKQSTTISFDPNCRPNLVKDKTTYLELMNAFADTADVIRMSDVDFNYLYETETYAVRAESLLAGSCGLFVITCGMEGVQAWHAKSGFIKVGAPAIKVVDTIGAGDSFQAALLFALHKQKRLGRARLKETGVDELRRALLFACNCAALTCTRMGADPPRSDEVIWR